jgi:serine/threonine-protein kinase
MINPAKGVIVARRYELSRPLARGGMGSVWVARHRDLDVDVTIKFMGPALVASGEARMRFEREARVAARLDSQHVVHVQDYGVEDETPYLVMELLKGESLAARLARDGTLALPAATQLLVQMCKALKTAHDAGLVHRDLKPGNVFLARKDEDEVVKILDFGIAKAGDLGDATANTESGVLMGSVHYMSPEQIRNSRAVDHRSDLWSIGVILYRALGGRLPFPGDKVGDVLVRVCTEPFPPLSSVVHDLPAAIDGFFERALNRDPQKRFQTATEMAAGFGAITIESTAPPTPSSPGPKWLQTAIMNGPSPVRKTVPLVPARDARPPVAPHAVPLPAAAAPWQGLPGAPQSFASPATPPAALPASPPMVAPAAPPAPIIDQTSQITLLDVTSPPRLPSRTAIVAAVLVPFALVMVVGGGAAVLWGSRRADIAPPEPASSTTTTAGAVPAAPEPAPAPPSSASAEVADPEPTPPPSATAAAAASVARPRATSATGQAPRRPAAKPGCDPPYRVDAQGLRVPKMECL